jgi:hypothetical protein
MRDTFVQQRADFGRSRPRTIEDQDCAEVHRHRGMVCGQHRQVRRPGSVDPASA